MQKPAPLRMPMVNTVWGALGFKGPAPQVFTDPHMDPRYLGQVPFNGPGGRRQVFLSPSTVADLQGLALPAKTVVPGGGRNLNSLAVLMHELAHTQQPLGLRRPIFEGGADAYVGSKWDSVINALHLDPAPGDRPGIPYYLDFVSRLKNNWNTINNSQFGR